MKRYKKVIRAIENLQKFRADNGIAQSPKSFEAIHRMRQVDGKEPDNQANGSQ